jgi:hypothetical protein
MLAARDDDGRYVLFFTAGTGLGEWAPLSLPPPAVVSDPFAWWRTSGRSCSTARPSSGRMGPAR